jgi:hypothetical protein
MLAADGRSPKSSGRHSDDASAMTDETTSTVVPTPPLPPAPDAAPNAPARRRARPDASQAGDGGRRLRSYTSQLEGWSPPVLPIACRTAKTDVVCVAACSSSAGLDASSSGAELSLAPRRIKLTFSSLSPSVEPDASACAGPAQPVRDGPAEGAQGGRPAALSRRVVARAAADPACPLSDDPGGSARHPQRQGQVAGPTGLRHETDVKGRALARPGANETLEWGSLYGAAGRIARLVRPRCLPQGARSPLAADDLTRRLSPSPRIISIDADLDLRDHLALSGTCRFLRR